MSCGHEAWRDAVAGALATHAAAVERLAPGHWTFRPVTPAAPRGSAHIAGQWLTVDVPLPARLTRTIDGGWRALAASATLAGLLKLCTAAGDRGLHLRADLPLVEDTPLAERIHHVCAAIGAAIASLSAPPPADAPPPAVALGDFAACDFDLQQRCRETQWPCTEREAQTVMVQLDVARVFQQAQVELQPERGVVASVPLLAAPLPAPPHETAVTRLLLATAGAVRMVRAATAPATAAAGLEVVFAHAPVVEELAHAFAALSVAWDCAGRETEILARDVRIARLYARDGVELHDDETVSPSTR